MRLGLLRYWILSSGLQPGRCNRKGKRVIKAFQSVTVGVKDAECSRRFYGELLGFNNLLGDSTDYLEELKPVIGALVQARMITLSEKASRSILQIVEHTSTKPLQAQEPIAWGDSGYLELGLRAFRLQELYLDLKSRGVDFVTPVRRMETSSRGRELYAYLRDPDGLLLQLVEIPGGKRPQVAGIAQVGVGVADMKKAREFYGNLLGLGETMYEFKGRLPELEDVTGGKDIEITLLGRDATGALQYRQSPMVKLIYTPGYKGKPVLEDRRWGDIGLSEMALRVKDLSGMVNRLLDNGIELLNLPARAGPDASAQDSFIYLRTPENGILKLLEETPQAALSNSPNTLRRALNKFREGAGTARNSSRAHLEEEP